MNQSDGIDPAGTRLRLLVAQVETAVAKLNVTDGDTKKDLEQAWATLVAALALGPEPEVRACPFCRRSILSIALRCRYCMKSSQLEPSNAPQ